MCNHDITQADNCQAGPAPGAGKIRDALDIARDKRTASLYAAQLIERHVSQSAYVNMLHCGDVLTMLEDEGGTHKRLKSAYFCGQRLCPGCAYRKSLATAVIISAISGAMISEGYTGVMVTVTAPNCTDEQLDSEIRRYNTAWNRLIKLKPYAPWRDHIRKIEVTYNAQADTYHPHIHALVFVRPGYFSKQGGYISQQRLLTDWRRCFGDDRITQVDIRRTHGQDWQAISELAKYVAKSGDYLQSQHVFDTFYTALRGKRLTGYAGRCRDLRAEYKSGGLRQFVERDLTQYVWEVIYIDYFRTGYIEETRRPYDPVIMGDDDIPITELLPREWDELAD